MKWDDSNCKPAQVITYEISGKVVQILSGHLRGGSVLSKLDVIHHHLLIE
jgi:hypothetical protein